MYLLSMIYVKDEHKSDQQKNAFNRYVTYVTQYVHLKVHCVVGNIDKILNRFRVSSLLISETLKILLLSFLQVLQPGITQFSPGIPD